MKRLAVLLHIAAVCIISFAQFPSPIAIEAGADDVIFYGNRESLQDAIRAYGEAANLTDDADKKARYKALQAELLYVAGQPEKALQSYVSLVESFSPGVSDYTRASVMCGALQAAVGLGYINDLIPYITEINDIVHKLVHELDPTDNLILYWRLTALLFRIFSNDEEGIDECHMLTYDFMVKYGAHSPQFALMCKLTGDLMYGLDRRSQALFNYMAALGTWDETKPAVGLFVIHMAMAAVYSELSDFKSTMFHIKQADKALQAIGLEKSFYGLLLSEIKCSYYSLTESYRDCLEECSSAKSLSEELFGPNHITYQRIIPMEALALVWTDRSHEALTLLTDLIGRQDLKYGISNMGNNYLNALSIWSAISSYLNPDAIINLHQEAETEIMNICSRKHALVYNFYEAWGLAYWIKGDYKNAAEKYRKSLESSRNSLHSSLNFLSEKDRAVLVTDIYRFHDNIFYLGNAPTGESHVAPLMYDNALFTKGVMLQSVTSLKRQVEMLPDSAAEAHALLDNFLSLKQKRLRGEMVSDYSLSSAETKLLSHLENHPEYGDHLEFLYTGCPDISERLGENDVAVEFVCSDSWYGERFFSAEVLRKGSEPRHVRLFSLKDRKKHLLNTDRGKFNRFVRDSIWTEELRALLPDGGNVYFVPTAELYGMALEYIPVGNEQKPMSDLYNMVRLSSSRELINKFADRPIDNKCTAAIYGGLNYNTALEDMELYALEATNRGHRGNALWQMLPGTRTEAHNVAEALHSLNPTLYLGDDGVEETFKALDATRTSIIHIATHGFYNAGDNSDPESALDRTGLIMSGANNYWLTPQAPKDIDDGVLTAREISDLDLRGTDLVVLSACQTGLGDVAGEGVYGLQRAFKMAGVQSILMSLWPVNDEATQVLMSDFYRNLTAGMTKREALASARKAVSQLTFTIDGVEHPGSDPYFWAAFVLLD